MKVKHTKEKSVKVTLTVDPSGPFPITLPPQSYEVAVGALEINRLGQVIGLERLKRDGRWSFSIDTDHYLMTVA